MKIVHIINSLGNGGAENMLVRLCCNNSSNDIEYTIITLKKDNFFEKALKENGITFFSLNISSVISLVKHLKRIVVLLKEADLVMSWLYQSDFFSYILCKLLFKKKLLWNIRHTDITAVYSTPVRQKIIGFNKKKSRLVDGIVYCSNSAKKSHEEIGYHNANSLVINNGYDISRFDLEYRKRTSIVKRIILVGRWHEIKGYSVFFEALNNVTTNVEFVVDLFGEGMTSDNFELSDEIKKSKYKKKIRCNGPTDDIYSEYKKSDILVSASFSEGFSNVLAEGMLSGLLCICTDVGDNSVILNNRDWIVDAADAETMGEKIKTALELSVITLKKIGESNREIIIRNYSMERISKKYVDLFEEIIDGVSIKS